MADSGVRMIQKHENPPCAPQNHPIENFFGKIKQKTYQNNWKAENRSQLEGKIRREITKIQLTEPEIFQKLFANLKKKIAYVKNHGLQILETELIL